MGRKAQHEDGKQGEQNQEKGRERVKKCACTTVLDNKHLLLRRLYYGSMYLAIFDIVRPCLLVEAFLLQCPDDRSKMLCLYLACRQARDGYCSAYVERENTSLTARSAAA